jgi:hypothetical protein
VNSGYAVCEGREIHSRRLRRRGPRAEVVPEQFALIERFLNGK